jgi:DNA uptake protein ComE-like DNA-binding protein
MKGRNYSAFEMHFPPVEWFAIYASHQPESPLWHRISMTLRLLSTALSLSIVAVCAACTSQNPDQIRQKTAEETAAIKRDTRAVAQGIKEGLSNKKTVDLNKASKAELSALPGITDKQADRIVAERPYADIHQLVSRHVLTEDEYAQIQPQIVVAR